MLPPLGSLKAHTDSVREPARIGPLPPAGSRAVVPVVVDGVLGCPSTAGTLGLNWPTPAPRPGC